MNAHHFMSHPWLTRNVEAFKEMDLPSHQGLDWQQFIGPLQFHTELEIK
jgi:hypothetical protein